MKPWFRFDNVAADATTADIHIIDFIGGWAQDAMNRAWGEELGVTARAFVEQLAKLPENVKTIKVHINSPGGDVQGGVNIANALRGLTATGRTVETYVTGIAASIASVIAMAGSKVHIADNALVMVHNPMSIIVGNAGEMRRMADILDTVRTQIVASYKWHSTLGDDELIALIDGPDGYGTWMDADQAIANGFATDKIEGLKAAASITPAALAKLTIPERFKARVDALLEKPAPAPVAAAAADVMRLCNEAGLDLAFAQTLAGAAVPLADVQARIAAERTRKAEATTRANGITAACVTAKLPTLAAGYINGGMRVEDVQAHLTDITARLDKAEIDANLTPNHGAATTDEEWKRAFNQVQSKKR